MKYKTSTIQQEKVNKFMKGFVENYRRVILYPSSLEEILYAIKEYGVDYYNIEFQNANKLTHKIIKHSSRVLDNFKIIMNNLSKKGYYFTKNEINSMYIAIVLHDIGKIITDNDNIVSDDHASISYLMVDYLYKNGFKTIIDFNYDIVLEIVYYHSKKTKHQDKISLCCKVVRDADLFDECCGESLFILLRDLAKCNNNNLNSYSNVRPEEFLEHIQTKQFKKNIIKRINIDDNIKLFKRELKAAEKQYNEYFYTPKFNSSIEDIYNTSKFQIKL